MSIQYLLAAHRQKAEAAGSALSQSPDLFPTRDTLMEAGLWSHHVTHIAANDPETVLAFIAVAEADDPEPMFANVFEGIDAFDEERKPREDALHIAWRKRQERRADLVRVLSR